MQQIKTNHVMFKNARQRYERELDMIKLLKSVRDGENFRKMFLSRAQQVLLKFGAHDLIPQQKE